jgi:hypothetical protein
VSLAIDLNLKRKPAPARRIPRWLLTTASAVIVLGLAALTLGMFLGPRAVVIEQPEREMKTLLKECKLSVTLHPTETTGQIIPGRDGNEWYSARLSPAECGIMIDALRARVDGRTAKVTANKGNTATAPAWWTPQQATDLYAFEIDAPTYWIAVAKDQQRLYLRRSR